MTTPWQLWLGGLAAVLACGLWIWMARVERARRRRERGEDES